MLRLVKCLRETNFLAQKKRNACDFFFLLLFVIALCFVGICQLSLIVPLVASLLDTEQIEKKCAIGW